MYVDLAIMHYKKAFTLKQMAAIKKFLNTKFSIEELLKRNDTN